LNRQVEGTETLVAIVPVNVLKLAKNRLAPALNAADRSKLSTVMLTDVLRAIRKVKKIHRIIVVSADRSVERIARSIGAQFLWEGKRRGLNKGLRLALRDASRRKASAALILPSDIPLITPHEISRFLSLSYGCLIALTPSKDGGGTNALLLRPPGIIRPSYGRNSFRRHMVAARRKGFSPKVIRSSVISVDIDEPSDLSRFRRLSLRNETGRLLRSIEADNEIKV
jgi:2-phospho-L-lactate guanylyltransferase